MSQFFESIRVVNGRVMNLSHHQIRVDRAMKSINSQEFLDLKKHIATLDLSKSGVYKLRISYNVHKAEILKTRFEAYKEKSIKTLKLVEINFNYEYKSEDREALNHAFAKKNGADDVLLVRNGLITDTWYCNVAFYNGEIWLTPKEPLLQGTMRAKLIQTKRIVQADIKVQDLASFKKIRLFNAMIPWSQQKDIPIKNIN